MTIEGLTARLRLGTRALHTQAERAGIMNRLLRGEISVSQYAALLRNLREIYASLEFALDSCLCDPRVEQIHIKALFRKAAIESDLDVLQGRSWRELVPLSVPAIRYVERIQEISANRPILLVAHVYVRYLGDLHGGQLLRRIVEPIIAVAAPSATRFYDFGSKEDVAHLIAQLRGAIDTIAITPEEATDIVTEARFGFGLHVELFEEIERYWNTELVTRFAAT